MRQSLIQTRSAWVIYKMVKWRTLEHNGVLFPPEYKKRGLRVLWEGQAIELNAEAEEAAGFYARIKGTERDTERVRANFWTDWRALGLGPIDSLEACDFSEFLAHFEKLKELRERFRETIAKRRAEFEEPYRKAKIDGKEEAVGNFRVEPPGIFLGRGEHPLAGRIKRRLAPSDFTLNLGESSPIPLPSHEPDWAVDGGGQMAWGAIVHDHNSEWLASWVDPLSRKTKYVWLATSSQFRAASDFAKFELARALAARLPKIRGLYMAKLASPEPSDRQLGAALYLIDRLALRVGHEKSSETSADTVGVTSLRREHLRLNLASGGVTLDFLGKDSVRYLNHFKPDPRVFQVLTEQLASREDEPRRVSKQPLFPAIDAPKLNAYLAELASQVGLPGLTAKVFRTCNASLLFDRLLARIWESQSEGHTKPELLAHYKHANAEVAQLCNHVRSKPANGAQQQRAADALAKAKSQLAKLRKTGAKAPRIAVAKLRVAAAKAKLQAAAATSSVSLATSRANYLDPRITVAFAKKIDVSPQLLLGKALAAKFFWALDTPSSFKF